MRSAAAVTPARRAGLSRVADPKTDDQQPAVAQLHLCTAAISAAHPDQSDLMTNLSADDHVVSVPCAPLGWTNIFGNHPSECIASPTKAHYMPSAIAAGSEPPYGASGHIRAEPPWVQFDRDTNDSLIGGDRRYWNDLGDQPYSHYPTCAETANKKGQTNLAAAVIQTSQQLLAPDSRQSPAMPIVTGQEPDGDHDPYGFGLPYRDLISRFVDEHREKIPKQAKRRMPFNALIARPVGSSERIHDPRARAAMEKNGKRCAIRRFGTNP